MAFYDIFNGDADGICALHQLRLSEPRGAELVTGTKREIRLVERVAAAAGDELTVLDISLDANRAAVLRALAAGARVRYFDHHYAGEIPAGAAFEANIDTDPGSCTSLLVDRALGGAHRAWAVVGAFGDNLAAAASAAAAPLGFAPHALARLQELGECLNYNAYGESVDDLYYPPSDLYRALAPYADPLQFIDGEPVFDVLRDGMADDLYRVAEARAQFEDEHHALLMLPDAAWSRRVAGVLGNRLAQREPARAHAIVTARADGFVVSVRAPIARPMGADALCRQFDTGGGRAGAAGINHLPQADFERFARAFARAFIPV
ncbi:MAG: acetyltransferase [Burkholderiales bacterium]|nr:acetyltransferase [Burkholderiales bacterium]